jgi:hypothetical protein
MDGRLVVLERILDSLHITPDVSNLDGRKRIQKAVYLTQAAGVGLGYGFGWYLRGPYSTSLARDYYAMALELRLGSTAAQNLRPDITHQLKPVADIVNPPAGVSLDQADWLELLASVHFLRAARGLDDAGVAGVLAKEKAPLAPHQKRATTALQQAGLLH